jgi:hypothetical protein
MVGWVLADLLPAKRYMLKARHCVHYKFPFVRNDFSVNLVPKNAALHGIEVAPSGLQPTRFLSEGFGLSQQRDSPFSSLIFSSYLTQDFQNQI